MKRVLVACEESQAVTLAFRKLGFEAFSATSYLVVGGIPNGITNKMCSKLSTKVGI